jgi:hypothetical protein
MRDNREGISPVPPLLLSQSVRRTKTKKHEMIRAKLIFLVLISTCIACAQNPIDQIDSLVKDQRPILFAKLANEQYVKVINEKWPEEVDESINLFTYNGKVRLIKIMPFSESGDWFYEVDNYFSAVGELVAYIEIKNHFNSICLDEAIHRTKIFVKVGAKFRLIKSTIQDSKGNDVSKLICEDPYDFKPDLIANLKKYLLKLGFNK